MLVVPTLAFDHGVVGQQVHSRTGGSVLSILAGIHHHEGVATAYIGDVAVPQGL